MTIISPSNVSKNKLVIDFRKRSGGHAPVYINGDEVEMVENFKFLGVQITNNLSWSPHIDYSEESPPMPLLSQKAKEIQLVRYNSY